MSSTNQTGSAQDPRGPVLITRRRLLGRTAVLVTGLAGVSGLVAACTSTSQPAPTIAASGAAATQAPVAAAGTPKRGGTLRALVNNDWFSLDPLFNSSPPTAQNMIYGQWIRWDQDARTGQWGPYPEMVAGWELKPDRVVLKLQKGVKFHDGTPWDAKAAKWNLDRMLFDPASLARGSLHGVDTSKEDKDELEKLKQTAAQTFDFSSKRAVEVVDESTVQLNLSVPMPTILMGLSNSLEKVQAISPTAYKKLGKQGFNRSPVGAGPFRFVEWKTSDQVILERNPDYWKAGADGKPLPYLDKIVYRLVVDDSVRLLELKSGNADFMELVQGKDIAGVKSDANLNLMQASGQGVHYRVFFDRSNQDNPFRSKKLRQALLYAMDRQAMVQTMAFGAGEPLRYFVGKGLFAYDDTLPYYAYDKAKAQQALKEAVAEIPGLAGSDGKVAVTFSVIDRSLDKVQAEMIKQMADTVGFNMKIEILDRSTWVAKFVPVPGKTPGKYEMGSGIAPVFPSDPDDQIRQWYHSKGAVNLVHQYDPAVDKMVDDAASTYDQAARKKVYREFQQWAYDNPWIGHLWQQNHNWCSSKKLKNFKEPLTSRWMFDEVWLD